MRTAAVVRRQGRAAAVLSAAVALHAGTPARLAAQENPAVRAAIALAAEGRSDSARTLLAAELRRARVGDGPWVEALYWRARLSVSGDSAERDLRRVALEHPASPWADDALLELSQLALAARNPSSAYDVARRLRGDYPGSVLRPRAALWAARAAFDTGEPRTACLLLDSARAEGTGDIEFLNQVEYYRGRCTAALLAAPPRPDTGAPPAPVTAGGAPATPAESARVASGWYVQVYASRRPAEAEDVVGRLARAELAAQVQTGADGYHRVRLGPFPSEDSAENAAARARRTVGGAPFVVRVR